MIQLNQIGVGNRITFISDDEIKAGIFLDEDGNGILTVKNSGSEKNGVSLARTANANFTHNYIVNGTTNLYVTGAGDGNITVTADSNIFTAEQITEIKTMFTGKMDDQNGYIVKEIDLLYKLIIWGKIDHSYTRTVRPFVIFEGIQNTNNATESLNYKLPCTAITANKTTVTLTTDCLAVIWSDGTVVDNQSIETSRTGAGLGDFYLFGDYTKLVASNQNISNISNISNDVNILELQNNQINVIDISGKFSLIKLDLSNNSLLNIYNVSQFAALEECRLGNTNSTITTVANNVNLVTLNLDNTNSTITTVANNVNLVTLNLFNTNSTITTVANNVNLVTLNLSNTNSTITTVANNINLTHLYLRSTNSTIATIANNINLVELNLRNTNSTITTVANNINLVKLNSGKTNSTITTVENNVNLVELNLDNTNSTITTVANNVNLATLNLDNTNSSPSDINIIMKNIKDTNTATMIKSLIFSYNADIDQSLVTDLVQAGWDIEQII